MRGPGAALLCVVALAVASCTAQQPDVATVTLSDACAPPEVQTVQGGSHLLGDTEPPVPYLSDPGTSGWHASGGGPRSGAYATAISEPEQVAVLERGGVVVAFDPDVPPATAGALLELGGALELDVVVTPHVRPLPTEVTITGWGLLARCGADLTVADVGSFADAVRAPGGH